MGNYTKRVKCRVWENSYSCKSQVGDTQSTVLIQRVCRQQWLRNIAIWFK